MQIKFLAALIHRIGQLLIARDRLLGKVPHPEPPEMPHRTVSTKHRIPSGEHLLDAVLTTPTETPIKAALLLCHGIGETVEHWNAAQLVLAERGVASLVFDYSGYGRSTGQFGMEQSEKDAVAAFNFLQSQHPNTPLAILGFSLGSAIASAVIHRVPAERLILCASFTSIRSAAQQLGAPRSFVSRMPDVWRTVDVLSSCSVPVLIVHGEKDDLFPTQMATELAAACSSPSELILVPNLAHNEPMYQPHRAFWSLITDRI